MITLLICVTLVVLEVVFFVFYYLKDKNDKEYKEYHYGLFDIIDEISYHVSLIKEDNIFGDTKVHIKNIERLCNNVKDEIEKEKIVNTNDDFFRQIRKSINN